MGEWGRSWIRNGLQWFANGFNATGEGKEMSQVS